MGSPAGPIYASTLHRRDRVWGLRRRGVRRFLLLLRLATWSVALGACAVLLIGHFG
jgi:hypothetical protein